MTTLICFVVGLGIGLSLHFFQRRRFLKEAHSDAELIIDDAKQRAQEIQVEAKERVEIFQLEAEKELEQELTNNQKKISELNDRLEDIEDRLKARVHAREDIYKKKKQISDKHAELVQHKENRYRSKKQKHDDLHKRVVDSLAERAKISLSEVKEELAKKLLQQAEIGANRLLTEMDQKSIVDSERNAKRVIHVALNRFARPYSSERGISYIFFSNPNVAQRVLGPEKVNLGYVEAEVGVDLIYNEDQQSISVSGFDPVRRELARASLEKLCNEKNVNQGRVKAIVSKTKKDLFKKIRIDGNKLANELKLKGLHPEVKNMMGALRYRYSFAQNQYFHCGEVGYLCGLLSAELGLSILNGRRAGMLHDIGKSMDHSIDGGHAVIGADFIERHGEPEDIVHAVRAHHYDEQPTTDLAFLVIAADAISGARPGARRSTADSYMQKMGQLEEIGNSFDGVLRTYILSAGREVRVHVNSQMIDDFGALELSQKVAHKIEDEVNYPGLIKVTVVREIQAVQVAK